MATQKQVVRVPEMTNLEFFERYAGAGRVGLVGGSSLIDRGIRRAERHLSTMKMKSRWSHAFLYQGIRADGKHWLLECDLDVLRNGVQENRVDKYADGKKWPNLAVLDFGLAPEQVQMLLARGLDMVAAGIKYSVRQALGTWIAMRRKQTADHKPYEKRGELYCSSFVQMLYLYLGIDFDTKVHERHTTPEHIARTPVPHTAYILER